MKIFWHALSFVHTCEREGTVTEICVSRDGGISVSGLCVVCGVRFSVADDFTNLIGKAAISDNQKNLLEENRDLLADLIPKGKPS